MNSQLSYNLLEATLPADVRVLVDKLSTTIKEHLIQTLDIYSGAKSLVDKIDESLSTGLTLAALSLVEMLDEPQRYAGLAFIKALTIHLHVITRLHAYDKRAFNYELYLNRHTYIMDTFLSVLARTEYLRKPNASVN